MGALLDLKAYRKSGSGSQGADGKIKEIFPRRVASIQQVSETSLYELSCLHSGVNSVSKGVRNKSVIQSREEKVKGKITVQRLLTGAIGLMMVASLWAAPPAADAAQRVVRLNIPGCLS